MAKLPAFSTVDWASFDSAFSKPEELPTLLAQLSEESKAAAVFEDVVRTVSHQGWAHPVAEACLPWLIPALEYPGVPLADLVYFLGSLCIGGSHGSWLGSGLDVERHETITPLVAERRDHFIALLAHDDAAVRAAAAYTLGVLSSVAPNHDELETAYGKEKKADVKASLLLALAVAGHGQALVDKELNKKRVAKSLEVAARCARVWLLGAEAKTEDLLELFEATQRNHKAEDLPWCSGRLGDLSRATMDHSIQSVLPPTRLEELLGALPAPAAGKMTDVLLGRMFGKGSEPFVFLSDLDERRSALIVRAAELWQLRDHYNLSHLEASGLPRSEQALRVMAGLDEPSVLDRVVTLDGKPMQFWRAIRKANFDIEAREALASAAHDELSVEDLFAAAHLIRRRRYYADVMPLLNHPDLYQAKPLIQQPIPRVASVLAGCLDLFGDEALPPALEALEKLAKEDEPDHFFLMFNLLVLTRREPLPERFDALAINIVRTARRPAPCFLEQVLEQVPLKRALTIMDQERLFYWGEQSHNKGVIEAGWGWWWVGLRQTPGTFAAIEDAIRAWSALTEVPAITKAKGTGHIVKHHAFPMARAKEIFAKWNPKYSLPELERLANDDECDPHIVEELLEVVRDQSG